MRKGHALFMTAVLLLAGGCSTTGKSPGEARSAPEAVLYRAPIETCAKAVEETLREMGESFTREGEGFVTEKRQWDEPEDMELRLGTYGTFVRKSIGLRPSGDGSTEVRVEVEVYRKDYLLNAETREDEPGLEAEVRGEFFEALGRKLSPAEKPRPAGPEDALSI